MYCPKCNNRRTRINGSHANKNLFVETRRRECVRCHYKFNTRERIVELADETALVTESHNESNLIAQVQPNGLRAHQEGGSRPAALLWRVCPR